MTRRPFPHTRRPRLSGLRLEPISGAGASAPSSQAPSAPPLPRWVRYAADVRYTANVAVPVTFTVERRRHGVRSRGLCLAPLRRPGGHAIHGPRCVRWQAMPGKYTNGGGRKPGRSGWRFSGRLPRQRLLPPGRYRMTAQVRGPQRTSAPKRVAFTIPSRKQESR